MASNDATPPIFDVTHGGGRTVINIDLDARDGSLQGGVDSFFQSMCCSYRTPTGIVTVSTPFMMNPGYKDQKAFKDNQTPESKAALASAAGLSAAALNRVQQGRGTPDEIHRVTQAVIDQQPADTMLVDPDAKVWLPLDVRRLMHDRAIGIDCAGYVQQAYLRATGKRRDQMGFGTELYEGLFGLSQRGFARFSTVADLRPGDIIVFTSTESHQPGHRTIVYDQRLATDDDARPMLAAAGGPDFASGGPVRVLEMDSSYGSGGDYFRGGVQRQTWLFNESSGKWAHLLLSRETSPASQDTSPDQQPTLGYIGALYGQADLLEGFYRRRGR